MGQCYSESDTDTLEFKCVICNKALIKSLFQCPVCKSRLGHMDCVTFWIITHKTCPYCENVICPTK